MTLQALLDKSTLPSKLAKKSSQFGKYENIVECQTPTCGQRVHPADHESFQPCPECGYFLVCYIVGKWIAVNEELGFWALREELENKEFNLNIGQEMQRIRLTQND